MNTFMERELCNEILDESALQQELTFGTTYRQWKESDVRAPIRLRESPINVPFKLCRASQRKARKKIKTLCKCDKSVFDAHQKTTLSLLDRSALSQEKYMDLLSIPNNPSKTKTVKPKSRNTICCKCQLEPCSPRLIQMSVPNKRYVLANWKDYQHFLPTERLLIFDRILKSGNNLDPREARYYFKQLRRKQKKELKRRRRLCLKKKTVIKKKYKLWFKHQIEQTVDAIVDFIRNEPLFMLNFHQMVTSDELLKYLKKERVVKVKSRNTKCVYKKTVVEISDKMIKWMDAMSFFADIQPLTSKEKLLEVPSLEGLLGAEGEEEEEEEEEEEGEEEEEFEGEEGEEMGKGRRKYGAGEEWEEDMLGEEGIPAGDAGLEAFMAKKILDKARQFGEDDDEMLPNLLQGLGDLDEDALNKLIQILSLSPQDFLNMEVQTGDVLAGVTYNDILQKLIEIRDGKLLEKTRDKNFLEQLMTEWAKNNDPESIDDKLLDKIHETSALLADFFKKSDLAGDLRGKGITGAEGAAEDELAKKLAEGTGRIEEEGEDEFKEAEGGAVAVGEGAEGGPPGEGGKEGAADGGAAGVGEAGAEGAGAEGAEAGVEGAGTGAEGAETGAEGVGVEGAGVEGAGVEGAGAEGAGAEGAGAGVEGVGAEGADAAGAGAEGAGAGEAGAEGAGVGAEGAEGAEATGEGVGAPGDATAAEGAAGEEGAGAEGVPGQEGVGEGAGALGEEGAAGAEVGGEEGAESVAKGEGEEVEIPPGMEGEGLGEGEDQGLEGGEKPGMGEALEGVPGEEEELEGAVGGPEGAVGGPEGAVGGPEGAEISEADKIVDRVSDELQRLDSLLGIIRGHKPSITVEHEPGTICCLSLKIWAVWLLEIANNAHNWTKWIGNIIKQVRHYASVIRGDHTLPSGEKKVLYKEEWRQFVKDTEEKVIAWRHYSKHVKDLSEEIMENFHGKKVTCCPKCLQDHLIKNVVTAHETLQSLTEAINCAAYWQRCLDKIVEHTSKITELEVVSDADATSEGSETYSYEIEELSQMPESSEHSQMSYDSMYEIEELPLPQSEYSHYDITEFPKPKPPVQFHSIEEMYVPKPPEPKEPEKKSGKKRDKSAGKGKKSKKR